MGKGNEQLEASDKLTDDDRYDMVEFGRRSYGDIVFSIIMFLCDVTCLFEFKRYSSRLLQGCKVARSQLLHDREGCRGPVCRPFITSTNSTRA